MRREKRRTKVFLGMNSVQVTEWWFIVAVVKVKKWVFNLTFATLSLPLVLLAFVLLLHPHQELQAGRSLTNLSLISYSSAGSSPRHLQPPAPLLPPVSWPGQWTSLPGLRQGLSCPPPVLPAAPGLPLQGVGLAGRHPVPAASTVRHTVGILCCHRLQ